MQPFFKNSCFLRIASKTPIRIQQYLHTAFLSGYDEGNLQNFFFSWRMECFVRKWRLKFQVSKYRLRWNAENMTSWIMSPKKITQLLFLRALYVWKSTSLLLGDDSLD